MVGASGAGVRVQASRMPLLPGALALAENGHFSGGMRRNRRHLDHVFGPRLQIAPDVPAALASLLAEAETSGGLLFSVDPARAAEVLPAFRARGEEAWEIGEVVGDRALRVDA